MTFKDLFPAYWYRAYPVMIGLGALGLAYDLILSDRFHSNALSRIAAMGIGAGVAALFLRRRHRTHP